RRFAGCDCVYLERVARPGCGAAAVVSCGDGEVPGIGDGDALVSKDTVGKRRSRDWRADKSSSRGKLYLEAVAAVTGDRVVTHVLSRDSDIECGSGSLRTADRSECKVVDRCAGNDSKCDWVACSRCQSAA